MSKQNVVEILAGFVIGSLICLVIWCTEPSSPSQRTDRIEQKLDLIIEKLNEQR